MRAAEPSTTQSGRQISAMPGAGGERLAALLDEIGDCVASVDPDGAILHINENGRCALSAANLRLLDGGLWIDLWPQEVHETIRTAFHVADEGRVARFEAFRLDDENVPCWSSVVVASNPQSEVDLGGYTILYRALTDAELTRRAFEISADEMGHRLKNSYAMVSSLLTGFARGVPEREIFAQETAGRLVALGAAQTLFAASDEAAVSLVELVPMIVKPFERPDCSLDVRQLPAIDVDRQIADAVSLVLGELAANSCKHGALSSRGSVEIGGRETKGLLSLTWSERSEKPIEAHTRHNGRGFHLMHRMMRLQRGEMTVTWAPNGLDVLLNFSRGSSI